MPPTSIVLLAPNVTLVPDSVEVPVLVFNVPPLSVTAASEEVVFCKSSVAPLETVVPPDVEPKLPFEVITKVPALINVAPT